MYHQWTNSALRRLVIPSSTMLRHSRLVLRTTSSRFAEAEPSSALQQYSIILMVQSAEPSGSGMSAPKAFVFFFLSALIQVQVCAESMITFLCACCLSFSSRAVHGSRLHTSSFYRGRQQYGVPSHPITFHVSVTGPCFFFSFIFYCGGGGGAFHPTNQMSRCWQGPIFSRVRRQP